MKPDKEWLSLKLLKNCFNDANKTHLGFKYDSKWYCITHNPAAGILIPKELLQMKIMSTRPEYLKVVLSKPKVVHHTNMKIHKSILKTNNKVNKTE